MTWKIKAKGAKQTNEVIFDDPKYAIFKADQWRSRLPHEKYKKKSGPASGVASF
jgi:hypothetical protein